MDAYTFFARGGVFANAQTGNIILMSVSVVEADLERFLSYFVPIVAFILGLLAVLYLERLLARKEKRLARRYYLAIEIAVLGVVALLISNWLIKDCDEMSQEALEMQAQLKGLRKWLLDFTRLKEAVPHDVILWNRLLVMATALGVADKVVKNLKVAYPELFNDPNNWPMYWWYYDYGYGRPPYSMVSDAMSSAHKVSNSALAASSDSSGSGGGGGFSGGGGGGFGGCGRM